MATYNSLGAVFKKLKLDKPIQRGVVRAANKALAKTKTAFVKDLKDETSLKTTLINKRIRIKRATFKSMYGVIGLAANIGVQIGEFAPRSKKVDVKGKTYYGVTAKILGSREFIPGGFLRAAGSGKELVLARKATITGGEYRNVPGAKYPTALLRTPILGVLGAAKVETYKQMVKAELLRIVDHEIAYSLNQYIEK